MIARKAEAFGVDFFVPFSSMHRYQRTDSSWANRYLTHLEDYGVGFRSDTVRILPAFIRYDCSTDNWEEIRPPEAPARAVTPEECGDSWSELLSNEDFSRARDYFKRIEHLDRSLHFLNLRVGGRDNVIEFRARAILVVDDGSPSFVASTPCADPTCCLIRLEGVGSSSTRNRGAAEARGRILAFVDDGARLRRGFVRGLAHQGTLGGRA